MGEVRQRSLEPNAVEITQGWAGWEEPRCPRSTQAWPGEQWPWAGASGISSHRQEMASGTCSRPDPRDTGDGVGKVRWGPQPGPAPTKLGEEIAFGHLGRVVLVQKVASIALLAEPTQPVLAHHRLLPDDVPKRAPHAWPCHTPTITAYLYPTAPAIAAPPTLPALGILPPAPAPPSSSARDTPAGVFQDVEEICSTHWVRGAQFPRHCQGLVALEVLKPSPVLEPKGQGKRWTLSSVSILGQNLPTH